MPTELLPPLLMTSEIGSFARKTIEERKPIIIDQILSHFDYIPEIRKGLQILKSELKHGILQPLHEESSDVSLWREDIAPWMGKTWLELPWFLAEAYFYRRILESVRYFQPGPWMNQDPYEHLKRKEISKGFSIFSSVYNAMTENSFLEDFQDICYRVLWGNRGDLSNLNDFDGNMGAQSEHIIINHSRETHRFLSNKPVKIAYIFDNVGKELFFDLAFIDYLLENGFTNSVRCYLKNQPFFVSDAMPKDLEKSLHLLKTSSSQKDRYLAQRIKKAQESGIIQCSTPPFFTSAHMFRQLPSNLKKQIASHDLVILKGDVNYRRLFGDRHWQPTTPIEKAAGYFPTSVLSFRTLKAEIAVGLSEEMLEYLNTEAEEDWRINGKRGMITFMKNL